MIWDTTLREMRKVKGWTQAIQASRTDISQPTIALVGIGF